MLSLTLKCLNYSCFKLGYYRSSKSELQRLARRRVSTNTAVIQHMIVILAWFNFANNFFALLGIHF